MADARASAFWFAARIRSAYVTGRGGSAATIGTATAPTPPAAAAASPGVCDDVVKEVVVDASIDARACACACASICLIEPGVGQSNESSGETHPTSPNAAAPAPAPAPLLDGVLVATFDPAPVTGGA